MTRKVIIGVLRREISQEEKEAFQAAFPGCELEFHQLDSTDYLDHAKKCRELPTRYVFLPLDRPIPSLAMEEGVQHVAFIPGQGLMELLPLNPEFKDFVPMV